MPSKVADLSQLPILAVFAHPDDEGFGSGATLAMLATKGARITLVCATNGDVGEISDPDLATPETLAQVRQEELRRAMAVTGISDVRFLGYRDSGMQGTEDNRHPASLVQAAPERVTEQLVDVIREVRPHLLMTHDPTGGYGHPDHKAAHRNTKAAYEAAGDETNPAEGEPWTTPLLYYVCYPISVFQGIWHKMVELGIEPPFARELADQIGSPDEDVTTILEMGEYVDTKIASLDCHRTQINPDGPFNKLPQEYLKKIMSIEYFTLAEARGAGGPGDLLKELLSETC